MRNLKKVIALIAVFAMLVSTVAFASAFSDVDKANSYFEAIDSLNAIRILTGDDDNNDGIMDFRPEATITRAEIAAIVTRIQNLDAASSAETPFTDVPSSHWASGYVALAAGRGIINGYGDGKFGPDDDVEYQDVIKMIMETLGYNPFVKENGGYPTGYLTAAQRYGVLDDVIGGGVGVKATRGQVAQMVYNAIDTPIMDKYNYGANASYLIYDGTNGLDYVTLLKRDLKMIKATGTVIANSYSNTIGGTTVVNTDQQKTIQLKVDNTTKNINYGLQTYIDNGSMQIYQGDVDADPFLGFAVTVYAKQNAGTGNYTLEYIFLNEAKNDFIAFNLDQFDSLTKGNNSYKLYYTKDSESSSTTSASVAIAPTIIYNGVAANGSLNDYFGDGKLIDKDTDLSGQVTLIDTDDSVAGYDVVNIEVAVTAVVKDVSSSQRVNFLKAVKVPFVKADGTVDMGKSFSNLDFGAEDTIINLTMDGYDYDYTDLEKWDVLTIVRGGNEKIYNVSVLGESNSVDGYVTSIKTVDGKEEVKLSDGNWYDVASGAYQATGLNAGDSGRFFIDPYGKIVARDKDVEVEGSEGSTGGAYAYVLKAIEEADAWGHENVRVQILDKSGDFYEAYLAGTTKFKNMQMWNDDLFDAFVEAWGKYPTDPNNFSVDFSKDGMDEACKVLSTIMPNNMITYAANSSGEIKTVTFGCDDETAGLYTKGGVQNGKDFKADTMSIGKTDVDTDTYVFFIGDIGDTIKYGGSTTAEKERCSVDVVANLAEGTYDYVAFDDYDSAAGAIVILNSGNGLDESTSVAVIDSVGTSIANGVDTVYTVDFWTDGEKETAVTKVDLDNDEDVAEAKAGDIWKFTVSNGIITKAAPVLVFDRYSDKAYERNPYDIASISYIAPSYRDTDFYFGLANEIKSTGAVNIQLFKQEGPFAVLTSETQSIKENDNTNVYIYDPTLKKTPIDIGSLGDVNVADELTSSKYIYEIGFTGKDKDFTAELVTGECQGMLDMVFARYYNNKAADIVVYKNYDFEYECTQLN